MDTYQNKKFKEYKNKDKTGFLASLEEKYKNHDYNNHQMALFTKAIDIFNTQTYVKNKKGEYIIYDDLDESIFNELEDINTIFLKGEEASFDDLVSFLDSHNNLKLDSISYIIKRFIRFGEDYEDTIVMLNKNKENEINLKTEYFNDKDRRDKAFNMIKDKRQNRRSYYKFNELPIEVQRKDYENINLDDWEDDDWGYDCCEDCDG